MQGKIKTYEELIKITKKLKGSIGLVTGCFDVLHYGHVSFLDFAKSKVDFLIVGIDSDITVKTNKGSTRPIFDEETRAKVIESLSSVDYVFMLNQLGNYGTFEINQSYKKIYKDLNITHLITSKSKDIYYLRKQKCAEKLGIKFLIQDEEKFSSSTEIIERLGIVQNY